MFEGGKASGFNNVHDRDEYDEDGVRMFRVRSASGEVDARATQVYLFLSKGVLKSKFKVEESSSSLFSNDAFIGNSVKRSVEI